MCLTPGLDNSQEALDYANGSPSPNFAKESDVYMFGMLMYEAFSGGWPYPSSMPHEEIRRLKAAFHRPPRDRAPCPDTVWDLFLQCTGRDPTARPTMAAVAERLQRLEAKPELHRPQLPPRPPAPDERSEAPPETAAAYERPPSAYAHTAAATAYDAPLHRGQQANLEVCWRAPSARVCLTPRRRRRPDAAASCSDGTEGRLRVRQHRRFETKCLTLLS